MNQTHSGASAVNRTWTRSSWVAVSGRYLLLWRWLRGDAARMGDICPVVPRCPAEGVRAAPKPYPSEFRDDVAAVAQRVSQELARSARIWDDGYDPVVAHLRALNRARLLKVGKVEESPWLR